MEDLHKIEEPAIDIEAAIMDNFAKSMGTALHAYSIIFGGKYRL
jgi:hypothetical protein